MNELHKGQGPDYSQRRTSKADQAFEMRPIAGPSTKIRMIAPAAIRASQQPAIGKQRFSLKAFFLSLFSRAFGWLSSRSSNTVTKTDKAAAGVRSQSKAPLNQEESRGRLIYLKGKISETINPTNLLKHIDEYKTLASKLGDSVDSDALLHSNKNLNRMLSVLNHTSLDTKQYNHKRIEALNTLAKLAHTFPREQQFQDQYHATLRALRTETQTQPIDKQEIFQAHQQFCRQSHMKVPL